MNYLHPHMYGSPNRQAQPATYQNTLRASSSSTPSSGFITQIAIPLVRSQNPRTAQSQNPRTAQSQSVLQGQAVPVTAFTQAHPLWNSNFSRFPYNPFCQQVPQLPVATFPTNSQNAVVTTPHAQSSFTQRTGPIAPPSIGHSLHLQNQTIPGKATTSQISHCSSLKPSAKHQMHPQIKAINIEKLIDFVVKNVINSKCIDIIATDMEQSNLFASFNIYQQAQFKLKLKTFSHEIQSMIDGNCQKNLTNVKRFIKTKIHTSIELLTSNHMHFEAIVQNLQELVLTYVELYLFETKTYSDFLPRMTYNKAQKKKHSISLKKQEANFTYIKIKFNNAVKGRDYMASKWTTRLLTDFFMKK
ncbi:MAG: hypothetical protein S4CHLAM20_15380 [Chlamydiia bacterium]|nr:hypothetical protein [Chlamydiia bacterium]